MLNFDLGAPGVVGGTTNDLIDITGGVEDVATAIDNLQAAIASKAALTPPPAITPAIEVTPSAAPRMPDETRWFTRAVVYGARR